MNLQRNAQFRNLGAGVLALVIGLAAVPLWADYQEAPMLAARVASGDLPPVEERLPDDPLVITPVERIGKYGGTWRQGMRTIADLGLVNRQATHHDGLVRWKIDMTGWVLNAANRIEVNSDATEYTFYLRPGMKWSDGAPFTADDVLFWAEDLVANEEYGLKYAPSKRFMAGGQPFSAEKIDDTTVRINFSQAQRPVPAALVHRRGQRRAGPLPQALPGAVPSPVQHLQPGRPGRRGGGHELAGTDGHQGRILQLARLHPPTRATIRRSRSSAPTSSPSARSRPPTALLYERNPYYWKVDTAGNQLPYIDFQEYTLYEDQDAVALAAANGQIDMEWRHLNAPKFRPLIVDNRDKGDYRIIPTDFTYANEIAIKLNLTHPDPVKREVFQNKNFRIGLSHAIDRQAIIDTVYSGVGEVANISPAAQLRAVHRRDGEAVHRVQRRPGQPVPGRGGLRGPRRQRHPARAGRRADPHRLRGDRRLCRSRRADRQQLARGRYRRAVQRG